MPRRDGRDGRDGWQGRDGRDGGAGGLDPALPGSVGRLRPLNAPVPVQVQLGRDGVPARIVRRGRARTVAAVQERWKIDEGWWWEHPVSRMYWRLVLDDGRQVTIYQDLVDPRRPWWTQRA